MSVRLVHAFVLILFAASPSMNAAHRLIPPGDPRIAYAGRWDLHDSLHARYSWPGVGLTVAFSGRSIGLRLKDGTNFFNVVIDGRERDVFRGSSAEETDYVIADDLPPGDHTLHFSRRNITFEPPYIFSGILIDSSADLLPRPKRPDRRIEFIGDSFTAAESNEATEQQLPWEARYPVTNIDKGFATLVAGHFDADLMTTCRSGAGMVSNWRGDSTDTLPALFDRSLMESPLPSWDFAAWKPDVAVVCLGLNDFSGLKGPDGNVSEQGSARFRSGYHAFLARLRLVYPSVRILAVAAFPPWIRENVRRVVDEEINGGHGDVSYCTFDEFPGGYVANGHPTVETHAKMAGQIIDAMEHLRLLGPGQPR